MGFSLQRVKKWMTSFMDEPLSKPNGEKRKLTMDKMTMFQWLYVEKLKGIVVFPRALWGINFNPKTERNICSVVASTHEKREGSAEEIKIERG